MKKKLLITLAAIMGGVIVVVIAQTFTAEDFDVGEHRQVVPVEALSAGDNIEERQKASEMEVRQHLFKQEIERRAGVDVDARNQQEYNRKMEEAQQHLDQLRQRREQTN